MLSKTVLIEQMNFRYRRFRDEVQHVGAGAPHTYNGQFFPFELLGDHDDLRSAGRGVDVVEHRILVLISTYRRLSLRCHGRVDLSSGTLKHCNIGRNLVVVVPIVPIWQRLRGK